MRIKVKITQKLMFISVQCLFSTLFVGLKQIQIQIKEAIQDKILYSIIKQLMNRSKYKTLFRKGFIFIQYSCFGYKLYYYIQDIQNTIYQIQEYINHQILIRVDLTLMILGTAITIFGVVDIVYFIKTIKRYLQLKQLIKSLANSEYYNVADVVKMFQHKAVGSTIPNIIVRGIIKSKNVNSDNNILSVITSNPINKTDHLKEYIFEKIPFQKVLNKAFWKRPQQLNNLSFNLQNLKVNNIPSLSVQSCKNTDVSGILTQVKVFEIIPEPGKNIILSAVKSFINGLLFLSPFKLSNNIGQKITYYSIMNKQFGYVFGQVKKRTNQQIVIENPKYVTKQISFILNRLKQNERMFKYVLIILTILQIVLLYYAIKWFYKNYLKKKLMFGNVQEQNHEQNVPINQLCIVCYSSVRSVIFKPCKHYGVCFNCYQKIKNQNCPVCKEPIQGIIRVIKK